MPGGKSDYLEKKLLDHVLRVAAFTQPAALHLGLFTVTPSDTGGGTEVTGGSYARVNVSASFGAAAGATATSSNSGAITFPTPTADWGTVVAWGIFDASTAGNLLYWGPISNSQPANNGNTISFPAATLQITED